MTYNSFSVEKLTEKALKKLPLSNRELRFLLTIQDEDQVELMKYGARRIRSHFFGNEVFFYGFVYFSTYCKNFCSFCNFSSGIEMDRYRKTCDEVLDICAELEDSGVHLIDLTMGEDPFYLRNGGEALEKLVKTVKGKVCLPLMVSPGVIGADLLKKLALLDVTWYACYQETYSPLLFQTLRVGQSFKRRFKAKHVAKKVNLLLEDGMLLHVGESTENIFQSIVAMSRLGVQQVRVMTYIPPKNNETLLQKNHHLDEEIMIAILRHIFPDRMIPASLDVQGIAGLTSRLMAGANVVSSIVPPNLGLKGVSQTSLDIEDGNRTVKNVCKIVKKLGLQVAERDAYKAWVQKAKRVG